MFAACAILKKRIGALKRLLVSVRHVIFGIFFGIFCLLGGDFQSPQGQDTVQDSGFKRKRRDEGIEKGSRLSPNNKNFRQILDLE